MEDQNKTVSTNLELVLTTALDLTKANFVEMQGKADRAKIALSKIVAIDNDAQDDLANKLLVKCKLTYDEIKANREAITKPLDNIKAQLMEPEKVVSREVSHTNSEANRVQKLRDAYATIKAKQLAEDQKKINAEKEKKDEIARLNALFVNLFHGAVLTRVQTMRTEINNYFNTITLANFDERAKKFALKPNLKQADFESWFIVEYDKNKVSTADFEAYLSGIKKQYTYDEINKIYISQADPIVVEFKNKLPQLKIDLQEAEELAKTNQAAADAKLKELQDARNKETEAANNQINEEIVTHQEETLREEQTQQLNNEFEQQVAFQGSGSLSGTRKTYFAKINCPPPKIVEVLSRALFANYQNPNWEGHYKRDKATKEILKDEQGNPVLQDWAETILKFYANNCADVVIDGIEVLEKFTAVTKK